MKTNERLKSKFTLLGTLGLVSIFMVSCGSYQNTSYYDNDGIYSRNTNTPVAQTPPKNENYYSNYFKQAGEDFEYFTDVENYSSQPSDSTTSRSLQAIGYGGWGTETDQVSVNIYNNNPWGYDSWYGGYPYYWGSSFSFGFGFNWGWGGYYSPWNSWYGWGYPYYGGHYGHYPYYPNYRYNDRYVIRNSGQRTGYSSSRSVSNNRILNQNVRTTNRNAQNISNSSRRVDPNFNSNARRANTNSRINNYTRDNRLNNNSRINTNSSRNNTRLNNSSRVNNNSYNNNSYNNNRTNSMRTAPSSNRSNFSSPSTRSGNFGSSSRMGSSRGGGRR